MDVNCQPLWRYCVKCNGLFLCRSSRGVCPAGGAHDPKASGRYSLFIDDTSPNRQSGWRHCKRCQGVFFFGAGSLGHCPAVAPAPVATTLRAGSNIGGTAIPIGTRVGTNVDTTSTRGTPPSGGSLSADGTAAGGGPHEPGDAAPIKSGALPLGGELSRGAAQTAIPQNYTLILGAPAPGAQPGWRWCRRCQALFFAGGGSAGVCPGTRGPLPHDGSGSGEYSITHDDLGPSEANWQWRNWDGRQSAIVTRFRPTTIDQIVSIVQSAAARGIAVRAAGSSWSFSDVARTTGYLVETKSLTVTGEGLFPGTAQPNEKLFHVCAGVRLVDLNERLDRMGLALKTMGGSAGQTLAGAISTGTHGGDYDRGPIADMVHAIQLVGPDGTVYWIERAQGAGAVSDAAAILARFPYLDIANIKYDDNWFRSVLVSAGSLGIICSYVVAVVPAFWLQQQVINARWSEVRARLADSSLFNPFNGTPFGGAVPLAGRHFAEILFSPNFAESDKQHPFIAWETGDRSCVVTLRADAADPKLPPAPSDAPPSFDLLTYLQSLQDLSGVLVLLSNAVAAVLEILVQLARPESPVAPAMLAILPVVGPELTFLAADLRAFAGTHPNFTQMMAHVFEVAKLHGRWILPELTKVLLPTGRKPGTAKSFEIMTGTTASLRETYERPPAILVDSLEVFLDATTPAYLDIVDGILNLIHGQGVFAGYVVLRYMQGTAAYLGMEQAALTCSVEVSLVQGQPGNDGVMTSVESYALQHGARLHWGQRNEVLTAAQVVSLYPKLSEWRVARAQLTRSGAFTTFNSEFTERCGLSTALKPRVYIGGPDRLQVPWQAYGTVTIEATYTVSKVDLAGPLTALWTTPGGQMSGTTVKVRFTVQPTQLEGLVRRISVQVTDSYGTAAAAALDVTFTDQEIPDRPDRNLINKILPDP